MKEQKEDTILFFDGECVLCHKTVLWILRNEQVALVNFCRLQSAYAQEFIPNDLRQVDSVMLWKKGSFYLQLDVFIEMVPYLKWYWKWLYILKFVPVFIRRRIYEYVAKHRKAWFGMTSECAIVQSDWKDRLID